MKRDTKGEEAYRISRYLRFPKGPFDVNCTTRFGEAMAQHGERALDTRPDRPPSRVPAHWDGRYGIVNRLMIDYPILAIVKTRRSMELHDRNNRIEQGDHDD